jgi:hypothetical protein
MGVRLLLPAREGTRVAEYPDEVAVDTVRAAYQSLGQGEVEPLVSLIDPAMEWRGRRRLRQFWRFWRPPS